MWPNWFLLAVMGIGMQLDAWPDGGAVIMEWLWVGCQ